MKKKIILVLMVAMVLGLFTGCEEDVQDKEKSYTEGLMNQINDEIGMPEITEFYEKKMAKEIFELRDDSKLICYAYTKNDMSGKFVYIGQCMGYGLPYSTQYTSPDKLASSYRDSSVISQADPNGLYSGDGLSATWVQMLDEETGERYIMYAEPEMIITQAKIPKRLIEKWSLTGTY